MGGSFPAKKRTTSGGTVIFPAGMRRGSLTYGCRAKVCWGSGSTRRQWSLLAWLCVNYAFREHREGASRGCFFAMNGLAQREGFMEVHFRKTQLCRLCFAFMQSVDNLRINWFFRLKTLEDFKDAASESESLLWLRLIKIPDYSLCISFGIIFSGISRIWSLYRKHFINLIKWN